MNFKNRYLFNSYNNILLNNQIILFCERSSISPDYLRKLKVNLRGDDFYLTSVKNGVFKQKLNQFGLVNLIRGPIFILYKKSLELNKNFSILCKFIDYEFILSCLFIGKLYSPFIFKSFTKIDSIERFFFEVDLIIKAFLAVRLTNTLDQLTDC